MRLLLIAILSLAAVDGAVAGPGKANPLSAALQSFHGHYIWDRSTEAYRLAEREALDSFLAQQPGTVETKVTDLIDCLSDARRSRVRFKSQPVSIGMVCYEGLTTLVYFEADAARWPGYVRAPTSARALLRAQRAWRDVVRQGHYTKL